MHAVLFNSANILSNEEYMSLNVWWDNIETIKQLCTYMCDEIHHDVNDYE